MEGNNHYTWNASNILMRLHSNPYSIQMNARLPFVRIADSLITHCVSLSSNNPWIIKAQHFKNYPDIGSMLFCPLICIQSTHQPYIGIRMKHESILMLYCVAALCTIFQGNTRRDTHWRNHLFPFAWSSVSLFTNAFGIYPFVSSSSCSSLTKWTLVMLLLLVFLMPFDRIFLPLWKLHPSEPSLM